MTTPATPAAVAATANAQPIYVRGFEVPSDGVYAMDGVTRTINKKAVGANLRTQVTYDVCSGAVPTELFNNGEIVLTAGGPGEVAGEPQFTAMLQYRDGYYVRATAYGKKAPIFRAQVMEAITQKRAFAALAAKVEAGDADMSELDKFPARILSFGLTGTHRQNFDNRPAAQRTQAPRQDFRRDAPRTIGTLMSMKLEELFLNLSDGTEVPVITVGSSAAVATEENFL